MRNVMQWIVIGLLFAAVGYIAWQSSGAADPLPGPATSPAAASGKTVNFASTWFDKYPAAVQKATAEKKLILARFTGSNWCTYCILFHKEIENTPEFQLWAAERVVLFDADFPRPNNLPREIQDQNNALAEKYDIQGYPTLLLLKADGTEVARLAYRKGGPKTWLPEAQAAVDAYTPLSK